MKMPVSPPDHNAIIQASFVEEGISWFLRSNFNPIDDNGRYLHWDKLRHLPAPAGLTSEQWWAGVKSARGRNYLELPISDKQQKPFAFCTPDTLQRELHWLDRHAAGSIQTEAEISNSQRRNTYLIRSLVEEAINSSQLEGASTTRHEAKEMIRQQRSPRSKSEQMIFNNYQAMQFIHEHKDEQLTASLVFELQRIVTDKTLNDPEVGRFRSDSDDIHVVDNQSHEVLHTPPPAKELPNRLKQLCDFANTDSAAEGTVFLHPVLKAIALHFMLAYDPPFCDGNGRTARALFYWAMAKEGYWLLEFVSISKIIKEASAQYGKAFLYTETDENDVTYFFIHQLEVIHKAIESLHDYLDKKTHDTGVTEKLLQNNEWLKGKLSFRQLAVLRHALKHPRFTYVVQEHQQSHGVSYDVARKDLLELSDKYKLLLKTKQGKRYLFVVPPDFEQRVSQK